MAAYSEDFLCGDDFDAVITIFCSHDCYANASKVLVKIATDEKDYHKCFLCVIVCVATVYQKS